MVFARLSLDESLRWMHSITLADRSRDTIRRGDGFNRPKRFPSLTFAHLGSGWKPRRTAELAALQNAGVKTAMIDETHDPSRECWVESAQGHPDFPLQNLPLGRFRTASGPARTGMALGNEVVAVDVLMDLGLLAGGALQAAELAAKEPVALSAPQRMALRRAVSALLRVGGPGADRARSSRDRLLLAQADCTMLLPARIGNFTDFNAGIFHTRNGREMRGDASGSLPRNYHHVPIAYHARASSVRLSGTPVRRPLGQTLPPGAGIPVYGPVGRLDIELELGIWVARGNKLGDTIAIEQAEDHIAGYCVLNDWSSRDVMAWEMDRLGPFLGKSFATTISPWIISPEALAPFRAPAFSRAASEQPLPYLLCPEDQVSGGLALGLAVDMRSKGQRDAGQPLHRVVDSRAEHLYWTPAQMVCHHASNGCNLEPGDLLGTGTISGPEPGAYGSFRELSRVGTTPFRMGDEDRCWAEDGDEVALSAWGLRRGYARIGFGPCIAQVLPAQGGPTR